MVLHRLHDGAKINLRIFATAQDQTALHTSWTNGFNYSEKIGFNGDQHRVCECVSLCVCVCVCWTPVMPVITTQLDCQGLHCPDKIVLSRKQTLKSLLQIASSGKPPATIDGRNLCVGQSCLTKGPIERQSTYSFSHSFRASYTLV